MNPSQLTPDEALVLRALHRMEKSMHLQRCMQSQNPTTPAMRDLGNCAGRCVGYRIHGFLPLTIDDGVYPDPDAGVAQLHAEKAQLQARVAVLPDSFPEPPPSYHIRKAYPLPYASRYSRLMAKASREAWCGLFSPECQPATYINQMQTEWNAAMRQVEPAPVTSPAAPRSSFWSRIILRSTRRVHKPSRSSKAAGARPLPPSSRPASAGAVAGSTISAKRGVHFQEQVGMVFFDWMELPANAAPWWLGVNKADYGDHDCTDEYVPPQPVGRPGHRRSR
ncbi:hypothetical protein CAUPRSCDRAFT_12637 [Caulochytrium protostelioides]|nr:hypothetical protein CAUPRSCDRAFT_12637 [Caulochytrium protostelioides]